jgi:hypothetical protein
MALDRQARQIPIKFVWHSAARLMKISGCARRAD